MKGFIRALSIAASLMIASSGAFAAGAIAVDDEQGSKASEVGFGIGVGDTREEAGRSAMAECRKAGNSNCKVAVRYDTCGAYAASRNTSGIGWGSSEDIARNKALDACGSACRIVVADCN
jgi:hypothetical protein